MSTTTSFTVGADTIDARITNYDGDLAFYAISGSDFIGGTILVQPARLGMHPQHGVLLTLGGYDTNGHVDFGDWALRGSVTCTGPDLLPGPAAGSQQYPLGQVRKDDPATADYIADVVAAIAAHYTDTYRGRGLR